MPIRAKIHARLRCALTNALIAAVLLAAIPIVALAQIPDDVDAERKTERPRSGTAAVHRAEHLHLAHRIELEAGGNAFGHGLDNLGGGVLTVGGLDEVEVGGIRGRREIGQPAAIDVVRGGDDAALGRLTEDFRETRDR